MLERLVDWMTQLIQTILSLLKVMIQSVSVNQSTKIASERCFILGNGPSLKPTLAKFDQYLFNESTICVNNFPNTPFYEVIQPNYFIIVSEEFWTDKTTIDPNTQLRKDIIDALITKTSWDLTCFLPSSSRKSKDFIQRMQSNSCIHIHFYNKTPIEGFDGFKKIAFRKGWGMPRPHNVLIPSLINSINLGFKEIILLGADHSWIPLIHVNENNEALVAQKHFYDTDAKADKMYRQGTRPRRLHEILEKFMLSFKAYFDIKLFATFQDCHIWNATEGSFIDAFDRKKVEDIFNE